MALGRLLVALFALLPCGSAALQWSVVEWWNGGFKVSFTLTAQQDLTSWAMLLSLSGDIDRVEVSVTGCSPLVGTLTGWR